MPGTARGTSTVRLGPCNGVARAPPVVETRSGGGEPSLELGERVPCRDVGVAVVDPPAAFTRSPGPGCALTYTDSPPPARVFAGFVPVEPGRRRLADAWVAQSVEQRTRNAQVVGSSPTSGSSSERIFGLVTPGCGLPPKRCPNNSRRTSSGEPDGRRGETPAVRSGAGATCTSTKVTSAIHPDS